MRDAYVSAHKKPLKINDLVPNHNNDYNERSAVISVLNTDRAKGIAAMNRARILLLLLASSALPACSTFELEGSGSITPEAVTGSETVHGSLYGFQWKEFDIEKCGNNTLFRVEYHTNAGLLLASLLTLGLYVPQTVEWWCNSPSTDDEDEEVWDPTA